MEPLLIHVSQTIETPRLILRAPFPGETVEINRAVTESFKELHEWMAWAKTPSTMEETETYSRQSQAKFILRQMLDYRIFLKDAGTYAGSVGLFNINWDIPSFELGYWLRSSLCGNGYMTESVVALTGMAMTVLKASRVEIRCDVNNVRSRHVAERAGFALEGILRKQARSPSEELRDSCIFAMVAQS